MITYIEYIFIHDLPTKNSLIEVDMYSISSGKISGKIGNDRTNQKSLKAFELFEWTD